MANYFELENRVIPLTVKILKLNLSPIELKIYCFLLFLSNQNFEISISYSDLSKIIKMSRKSLIKYINILMNKSIISKSSSFNEDGGQSFNTFKILVK